MARPFMFAALCQRAHPLKHSLAESEKQRKKSSLAEKFVSRSLVSRGITVFIYIFLSSTCTIVSIFSKIDYRNNFVIYPCTHYILSVQYIYIYIYIRRVRVCVVPVSTGLATRHPSCTVSCQVSSNKIKNPANGRLCLVAYRLLGQIQISFYICPSQRNCNTYQLASMKQRNQETVIITVYKLLLMFRKIIRASELVSVKRCHMIKVQMKRNSAVEKITSNLRQWETS